MGPIGRIYTTTTTSTFTYIVYTAFRVVLSTVAVCHMHSAACQILIMPSKNEWELASVTWPKWKMVQWQLRDVGKGSRKFTTYARHRAKDIRDN